MRSIREGQNAGKYLVVSADILELWPDVICSPLGAVEKNGIDPSIEVRLIHDLSFPRGGSTNDMYDKSTAPNITYQHVTILARRIEELAESSPGQVICIMNGDVKGAFRHLMTNAAHVHRMAALLPELNVLVIDLAAPFGWSASPSFYGAFGRGISWLLENNSPASVSESTDDEPFFGYEWVDDHILIEIDRGDRLALAEATLRHAMLAILGPRSINEAKFSAWSTELFALGLLWNTEARTVSIPATKIAKGLGRVQEMIKRGTCTKTVTGPSQSTKHRGSAKRYPIALTELGSVLFLA
ncbi:hypothetical protein BBJ28_00026666 [Nothophytophthora sp. Chile5]|nr:hypothetical protein BBJ28_00026666 [Nothophytophthora sp. Chile5]